jgi:hypothetical protein
VCPENSGGANNVPQFADIEPELRLELSAEERHE